VFSYVFLASGTYTVTLTARNTSGATTVTRQVIVVATGSSRVLMPIVGKR
jgi:PKD repeat protein